MRCGYGTCGVAATTRSPHFFSVIMSMSVPVVDLSPAHNRKASNALCTLVKREEKSFGVPMKTVKGQQNDTIHVSAPVWNEMG